MVARPFTLTSEARAPDPFFLATNYSRRGQPSNYAAAGTGQAVHELTGAKCCPWVFFRQAIRNEHTSSKSSRFDSRERHPAHGLPVRAVVALLGKPAKVFASGTSESWDYLNAAYDPVSGRTVRRMEVLFRNGVVEYFNTSF